MTISRRLDSNTTDIQTWVHWHDGANGEKLMTVQNIQDVEGILERNKAAQRYYAENPQRGHVREVAEIPMVIQYKFLREYGVDVWSKDPVQKKKLRRLLDSNEFKYLRADTSFKLETK